MKKTALSILVVSALIPMANATNIYNITTIFPDQITDDWDKDGIPNATDPDDDGDGIPDVSDDQPFGPVGGGSSTPAGPPDTTPDGDWDGDGTKNSDDPDDDNDNTPDTSDADPFTPQSPGDPKQDPSGDWDEDGTPNSSDPDDDNDNTPDTSDADPFTPQSPGDPKQDPSGDWDEDGTPNSSDPDDDGDGTPDTSDSEPFSPVSGGSSGGGGTGALADNPTDFVMNYVYDSTGGVASYSSGTISTTDNFPTSFVVQSTADDGYRQPMFSIGAFDPDSGSNDTCGSPACGKFYFEYDIDLSALNVPDIPGHTPDMSMVVFNVMGQDIVQIYNGNPDISRPKEVYIPLTSFSQTYANFSGTLTLGFGVDMETGNVTIFDADNQSGSGAATYSGSYAGFDGITTLNPGLLLGSTMRVTFKGDGFSFNPPSDFNSFKDYHDSYMNLKGGKSHADTSMWINLD